MPDSALSPASCLDPALNPAPDPALPKAIRSPEYAELICSLISDGHCISRIISGDFGFTCTWQFIYSWIEAEPDFERMYARARQRLADVYVDQIITLAESATNENFQQLRLQIDTKKWVASKVYPKVYGDKPAEVTVNNVNNILVITEEQRQARIERRAKLLNGSTVEPDRRIAS